MKRLLPYQNLVFIAHAEICNKSSFNKSSYNKNKLEISAPTWNDKFELPDGSYSVSDIQD